MTSSPRTPTRSVYSRAKQAGKHVKNHLLIALLLILFAVGSTAVAGNTLPAPAASSFTPVQALTDASPDWSMGDYRITPLASYEITARVLSSTSYEEGREAELSPLDLALGWGPMADDAILQKTTISQSDRWYFVRWKDASLSKADVIQNSANTHIIPATEELTQQLMSIEPDQTVRFRGYLIQATADDGWSWKSSMSRSDTGDGSCEVLWVEEVELLADEQLAETF